MQQQEVNGACDNSTSNTPTVLLLRPKCNEEYKNTRILVCVRERKRERVREKNVQRKRKSKRVKVTESSLD